MMSAPASAKLLICFSGFEIMRWTSSVEGKWGLTALTMEGPKEMEGTKCPSMTSI